MKKINFFVLLATVSVFSFVLGLLVRFPPPSAPVGESAMDGGQVRGIYALACISTESNTVGDWLKDFIQSLPSFRSQHKPQMPDIPLDAPGDNDDMEVPVNQRHIT